MYEILLGFTFSLSCDRRNRVGPCYRHNNIIDFDLTGMLNEDVRE